ncbi:MAG: acyl-CoA thioesterase [Paracoccus sp. (in: a-proteobacteria)]|nr:acyl-CoA thioesterase [Paracoccus sp. (in: a-proteobacteria)]
MGWVHEIRVSWGDCDPARIAYTARIPWFALDAIDAWWLSHLGQGWYQLEIDRGLGTPFVNMNIDFLSPVTPRHMLECDVRPVALGKTSVAFRVTGRQGGKICFEGRFVCVFVTPSDFTKCAPPPDIGALLAEHMAPDEPEAARGAQQQA